MATLRGRLLPGQLCTGGGDVKGDGRNSPRRASGGEAVAGFSPASSDFKALSAFFCHFPSRDRADPERMWRRSQIHANSSQ